jgi:hypothetical protein
MGLCACFGLPDQFFYLAVLYLPLVLGTVALVNQIIIGQHGQFKDAPNDLVGSFFKGVGLPDTHEGIGQHA